MWGTEEKHEPNYNSAAFHLQRYIKPSDAKAIVKSCIRFLKTLEFDAVAFRGLSGALIAPTIAMEMGKELIAVRKHKGEHSSNMVEGDRNARTYVIVDDFIGSGNTVRVMLDEIEKYAPGAECIGVLQAYYINKKMTSDDWLTFDTLFVTEIVTNWKDDHRRRKAEEIMLRKAKEENQASARVKSYKPEMKRWTPIPEAEDYSQWKTKELLETAERNLQALGLPPLQKALKPAPPKVIAKIKRRLREQAALSQSRLEQDRANFRARMNIDRQPSSRMTTYM